MPVGDHPCFNRPLVTDRLWRYTDLAKFLDLITSKRLWLSNAEVLAGDDPYEGLPGAIRFPHRMWNDIRQVPEPLRAQIIEMCSRGTDGSPAAAFRSWFMVEEQRCIMEESERRDFYVNCWHAAPHESVAMWKIYGAPGAGIAIVSNGGRVTESLAMDQKSLFLGAVRYVDPDTFMVGGNNIFDIITTKRSAYSYEREVRLVYFDMTESHDPLGDFAWNDQSMRFDDLIEDPRPLMPGCTVECDLDVLIEKVIVSPFAPLWYVPMIERVLKSFGLHFPVTRSQLLTAASVIS